MAAGIAAVAKPLLAAHLDDLEQKLQPGLYLLTWTSMNIDGYLHRIHQVLLPIEATPVLRAVCSVPISLFSTRRASLSLILPACQSIPEHVGGFHAIALSRAFSRC